MRSFGVALAATCLLGSTLGAPQAVQQPLRPANGQLESTTGTATDRPKPRPLKGRFLHITDLHPDPFFKEGSDPDGEACHRKHGAAGFYGAAKTQCDSPFSLINATFAWIDANLKDEIDFVVWTGDSARHDNDERHPRDRKQVTGLNEFTVTKFREVFGADSNDDDPITDMSVPIVPTLGNNDILPHNVFFPGPNRWTRTYLDLWRAFIPEAQRHGFEAGGWFFREVIPNHLAVFSLNSLYFFDHNSAVDGCASPSEPGYQQFEWLRIQLQFLRRRGMKAILIGHVPPARTSSKQNWDESCWQKYTLWMRQYRDVVIGSVWGHMNIDHFMLQDTRDVEIALVEGQSVTVRESLGAAADGEMTTQSSTDYLVDLRKQWKHLPRPPKGLDLDIELLKGKGKKKKKKQREKYFKKIGGEFAERYSLGLVSPSIVPNYYPTLRIMSYNISGLEDTDRSGDEYTNHPSPEGGVDDVFEGDEDTSKKHRKKFKKPKPPSKSTSAGPAYSMQPLSWTGYQQLFANLTALEEEAETQKKKGKDPPPFAFTLEYDTRNDSVYNLPDLTVRSYLRLAQRLGRYKASSMSKRRYDASSSSKAVDEKIGTVATTAVQTILQSLREHGETVSGAILGTTKKKHKKKKGKKHKNKHKRNKPWLTFWNRAFVGSREIDIGKLDVHVPQATTTTGSGQAQQQIVQEL